MSGPRGRPVAFVAILLVSMLVAGCLDDPDPDTGSDRPDPLSADDTSAAAPSVTPIPSGSAGPPTPRPSPAPEPVPRVFVLDYTLVAEDDAPRSAHPGGHCGRAWVEDDNARLYESDYGRLQQADAIVLVFPSLSGNWSTTGTQGLPYSLPMTLDPRVADHNGTLPRIAWDGENVTVDAVAVALPYTWTFRPDEGGWRVEATLTEGPKAITLVQGGDACW